MSIKNIESHTSSEVVSEGFLNKTPERTIKIKITGDEAFLTVESIINQHGNMPFEWALPIPVADAELLMNLCRLESKVAIHAFSNEENQEIERKFLVSGPFPTNGLSERIAQGYLNSSPDRTVRVRLKGDKAFITIKGIGNDTGMSRFEWEKEISVVAAELLMPLCEPGAIIKTRHYVDVNGSLYEVDSFKGENLGLVIAEIELTSEDQPFARPDWLGQEVTGNPQYYNSALTKKPFLKW
ncbi:CYTH domain-containing protein [Pseudomonas luteola]